METQMNSNNESTNESTLAATFLDKNQAHDAARVLKDEGFENVWIGLVKRIENSHDVPTEDERIDISREASPAAKVDAENWFQRVFGDGNHSLKSALLNHGVSERDVSQIDESDLGPVLLTVNTSYAPDQAYDIIESIGGEVLPRRFDSSVRAPYASQKHGDLNAPVAMNTVSYEDSEPPDSDGEASRLPHHPTPISGYKSAPPYAATRSN
jgi:hypothetical protein